MKTFNVKKFFLSLLILKVSTAEIVFKTICLVNILVIVIKNFKNHFLI